MGVREKLAKNEVATQAELRIEPIWVRDGSDTTKKLYAVAADEFSRVQELIRSGNAARPKTRWLVRATIASRAVVDRSLINPRRQPFLCDWIETKNQELNRLYSVYKPATRGTDLKTKRELEKEVSKLRKVVSEQVESDRRAIVEAFFDSNMLDDRDSLRKENSRLRNENRKLVDSKDQLQRLVRESDMNIVQLWEILSDSQRLKLGWRPKTGVME